MRKLQLIAAVMAIALVPALGAFGQSGDGQVIVVHGVPGLTVDVYVNGELTLDGFEYGQVVGPINLPAGSYQLDIYAAGADPEADDPALSGSADLPAGAVATIAAYLQEGGTPTLGVFVEDNSNTAAGEARVTARHLADFGAVDILANDGAVFEGVTNGAGGSVDVPAGTYNIKITAAGDPATVAFDADVAFSEGTNTIAYAIGSVAEGTFQVVTAQISGLATAPGGVPTGTGGLAADGTGWLVLTLAGMALVAFAGGRLVFARSRS